MSSGTEVAESDGETVDMKKADEPAPAEVSIANAEEEIEEAEEAEEREQQTSH